MVLGSVLSGSATKIHYERACVRSQVLFQQRGLDRRLLYCTRGDRLQLRPFPTHLGGTRLGRTRFRGHPAFLDKPRTTKKCVPESQAAVFTGGGKEDEKTRVSPGHARNNRTNFRVGAPIPHVLRGLVLLVFRLQASPPTPSGPRPRT